MTRRPYIRPWPRTSWYLGHARYRSYMLRELTCVIVAVYCVLLLAALAAVATGDPAHWSAFIAAQQHPGWIAFHAIALVFFTIYQTAAWFRLAPKAMPLPPKHAVTASRLVVAGHYAAWVVLSAAFLRLAGAI